MAFHEQEWTNDFNTVFTAANPPFSGTFYLGSTLLPSMQSLKFSSLVVGIPFKPTNVSCHPGGLLNAIIFVGVRYN